MSKEEFLLRAVKDGSITIDEAISKLEENSDHSASDVQFPKDTKQLSRQEVIAQLTHDALHDRYEDDPEDPGHQVMINGLDWDAIREYLIRKDWHALDLIDDNHPFCSIKDNPVLALHNAEMVAHGAIKDLYKKIDANVPEDERVGYYMTGVFEARAEMCEECVTLEVIFMPSRVISSINKEEFENAK